MGPFLSKAFWPRPDNPVHPLQTQSLDQDAITSRYEQERAKRLRDDGYAQFQQTDGAFSRFQQDVAASRPITRAPVTDVQTNVLIIGGGFAGLVTAVNLKKRQIDDFVIVERGGDFGGTWYWNQYPGATCDVESILYLPFLEETGYIPKERFASGPEIRAQVDRIVRKWDLARHSYLQTVVTSMDWDERQRRWHVRTSPGDHFVAQFVVMATGTLHRPKLPGLPGIDRFTRDHFHSGRWDYAVTGGSPTAPMTRLADKTVGVIGTGASGVQVVPQLAQAAKKVYVFQRTPSSVQVRHTHPPDARELAALKTGWQRRKMDEFARILQGELADDAPECSALDGLDALTLKAIHREAAAAGATVHPNQIPELLRLADLRLMERIRALVDDTVRDAATAARLKPWYSFMCKRPAFSNGYLAAFNRPNVELVDTDGRGVDEITETAVIANGHSYDADVLIYCTGFEFETGASLFRRTGIELRGTQGRTLDETWDAAGGPCTLFGIHSREFPNLFHIGPAQAGVTANQLHNIYLAGEHIAEVVVAVDRLPGVQAIEPSADAEQEWGQQIEDGTRRRVEMLRACPPGYYNKEGRPEEIPARWGPYPPGIVAWEGVLKAWRAEGSMQGMEMR
ncbi:FAD/NAD(P)-binding domain-containing protein [Aspergillus bertholletiae]|uniref:FAD/NAD(P)-binding domain-containing protein n=1 Tax=Aspergillus bertholletiae TaxID=1226010 RepID=A0A5N7ATV4_9EURO|nr:FAD/NAD(P)-binding domain-containing protein [Aspergillus bertholletiae]